MSSSTIATNTNQSSCDVCTFFMKKLALTAGLNHAAGTKIHFAVYASLEGKLEMMTGESIM